MVLPSDRLPVAVTLLARFTPPLPTRVTFWAVSVPLYLNRPWTKPIWQACRARDGRDWMLNSGVLKIRDAGARTHAVAAALFAAYPLCLWLGYRHGRR